MTKDERERIVLKSRKIISFCRNNSIAVWKNPEDKEVIMDCCIKIGWHIRGIENCNLVALMNMVNYRIWSNFDPSDIYRK
jgi:hypothetical protein